MGFINDDNYEPENEGMPKQAFVHEGEKKKQADNLDLSKMVLNDKRGMFGFENFGQFTQYVGDAASNVSTAATLGIPDMVDAGITGTLNLIRGKEEPYAQAWEKHVGPNRDARDRMAENYPVANVASQLAGGFMPLGPASMLDKAVDVGGLLSKVAPGLGKGGKAAQTMLRAGKIGAAGAAANVVEGIAFDETSVDQMVNNGLWGAALAPIMQIGMDASLPKAQKLINRLAMRDDFGKALKTMAAKGPRTDALRFSTIAGWLDDKPGNWKGTMQDIAFDATEGAEETTRRMHNSFAEIYLPEVKDEALGTRGLFGVQRDIDMYHKALDTQYKLSVEADDAARREVREVLDSPQQRITAVEESNANLKKAREVYAMMSDETPQVNPDGTPRLDANGQQVMGLGAKPIDARKDVIPQLDERLMREFKRTDINRLPEEANKMREEFLKLLRTREMDEAALRSTRTQSAGAEKFHKGEVDVYDDVTLAKLIDARRTFSTKFLSPMATYGGDAITRTERKAARDMVKMIDDLIGENTNGAYGIAKEQFAKSMKQQEAFDMGKEFYLSRTGEFADSKSFAEEYGKDLTAYLDDLKDDALKDMFKAGFSDGMEEKIGQRGFMTEMHYFLGDFKQDPESGMFFSANERGIDQMKSIFGEEETQRILDVYTDGSSMQKYRAQLAAMLRAKGADPDKAKEFLGDATIAQSRKHYDPANGPWEAGMAFMDWMASGPSDKREARALMRLMAASDEEVAYLMERGVREAMNITSNTSSRVMMGGLLQGFGTEEGQEESEATRTLREYLEQQEAANNEG